MIARSSHDGTHHTLKSMAHLIKRKRSPFWAVRFRDPQTGKWRQQSTQLRINDRKETRKAQEIALRISERENQSRPVGAKGAFMSWAHAFLRSRHAHQSQSKTLSRYLIALNNWMVFFDREGITHPSQLTYDNVRSFLDWRRGNKNGG